MKTQITKADVPSIIASIPSGAIFGLTFVKKDGSVREMQCRKGVVCGLTPNARPKAPNPSNIITVYDMKIAQSETNPSKAYRAVDVNRILSIRAEKQEFEVK